jgi:integrase
VTAHLHRASPITSDNIQLSKPISVERSPNGAAEGASSASWRNPDRGLAAAACKDPEVLRLIAAASAPNTRRAYAADLDHFLGWGGSLPAGPEIVARYLADHGGKLAVATLARRLVGIGRAHVHRGLSDPTKAELVRLALRGIRRLYGCPQRRVAPLRAKDVYAIVSGFGSSTRDVRDRAILLLGFAGAFRRSEISSLECRWIERTQQGLVVTLHRSKTDQEGRGRRVAIPRAVGIACPVVALEAWLEASAIADGPVFRPVTKTGRALGSRLSADAVAIIVKQHAAAIGLDPARYSGHSLRAGFATSAAAAGVPTWKIKAQTGHVSDAVLGRYIRDGELFTGGTSAI